MLSGRNKIIAAVVFIVLLISLIFVVVLSQKQTNSSSSASAPQNLNTSAQIESTNNSDETMGPSDSSQNFSAGLSKTQTGTLTFSLMDPFPTALPSPASDSITSFLIRVRKIEVLSKSAHWETLTMPLPIYVDLAAINNSGVANLGQTALSAESYSEVRIYIDKASVSFSNGTKTDLSVGNGVVRVARGFDIEPGKNTNVTVDFDASKSYLGSAFSPFVANFLVSH